MDTRDAAQRWADTWQRCWVDRVPEPIAALYAPNAEYRTEPFRKPQVGPDGALDYIAANLRTESDMWCHFAAPLVDGDRAAVPWWASYIEDGKRLTLAGTSILRFDPDGLVVDEWDTWNFAEGEVKPHEGWGKQ